MDSYKRSRSVSTSSSASSSSSTPASPSSKALRSSSSTRPVYTCTLPPSCSDTLSTFSSLDSLEAHHRTYHAFVCTAEPSTYEWAVGKDKGKGKGKEQERDVCGRVFPDEHILALHLTECHDELAQLRRERGEKIFACLVPSCSQLFSTPKNRRLHLIDQHSFPSQYFFAVTIWGVEDELSLSPPPERPPPNVDDLAIALAGTSISLVPRSVQRAHAKKSKMAVERP
ncbi:hypothetical protein JCM8547_008098 [Rhodosporidiobolus lusitaniae]